MVSALSRRVKNASMQVFRPEKRQCGRVRPGNLGAHNSCDFIVLGRHLCITKIKEEYFKHESQLILRKILPLHKIV